MRIERFVKVILAYSLQSFEVTSIFYYILVNYKKLGIVKA